MKRILAAALALLLAVAGLFYVFRLGAGNPEPPVEPATERPEARAGAPPFADSTVTDAGRETVAELEPRVFTAEAGHISGVVVDPSEQPIEGALCQLFPCGAPLGLGGLVSRPVPPRPAARTTRTNERGEFRLAAAEGYWTLRVEAVSMSPWEEGHLRPGDFRWIRMLPARELTVLVRDERHLPVAGAEVRLIKGQFSDPELTCLIRESDASGTAHLASIPAGTWYVRVTHPDYAGTVQKLPDPGSGARSLLVVLERGIRVAGKVSLAGGQVPPPPAYVRFETMDGFTSSHVVECRADGRYASRLSFAPGETMEVAAEAPGYGESRKNLNLEEAPASREYTLDFVLDQADRSVTAKVVDPQGLPLAGVEVYLKPLISLPPETLVRIPSSAEILAGNLPNLNAYDPQASPVSSFRRVASSGADGRFSAGGLHPRKPYNLLLVSAQYSNASLWVEESDPGATTDLGTVVLPPKGRVWGYVRRPDGSPIEGALVYSAEHTRRNVQPDTDFRVVRPAAKAGLLETITNDEGLFAIEPFPAAEFFLMCYGTQFGPYTLAAGETLGPLDLVTEDVSRKDRQRAIPVVITVVDLEGAPVPTAFAQLLRVRPAAEEPATFLFHDWSYALADAAGRIELDASEEGSYELEVKDAVGQLATQSLALEVARGGVFREVVLMPDPDPAPPLAGEVRRASGEAAAGVQVTLVPATGRISCNCLKVNVLTDDLGGFSFGRFMKGNHRLVVTDPQERFPPAYYYPARPGDPLLVTVQ